MERRVYRCFLLGDSVDELASENIDGRYPRSALYEFSDLKLGSVRFTESSRKEMVALERLSGANSRDQAAS
jgi:hypothetical protein